MMILLRSNRRQRFNKRIRARNVPYTTLLLVVLLLLNSPHVCAFLLQVVSRRISSSSSSFPTGTYLASTSTTADSTTATAAVEWEVYVDQSKVSLERGAGATLDSFLRLAPAQVKILPAVFGSASKAKSPMVRCLSLKDPNSCLEVTNVDSVDKVYRILTRHMKLFRSVNPAGCECIKWTYKGNSHLEAGEISLAIDAYDKALATNFTTQEGKVLLMRAAAFMERAAIHKLALKDIVQDVGESVPSSKSLSLLYQQTARHPAVAVGIFERVLADTRTQESIFLQTKFRHGLYQYALLHAARDTLQATQLLPQNTKSWLQAGEILSELWILSESVRYYEKAMEVNPSLRDTVSSIIERLRKRKEVYENARSYGWPEDIVRLALDVAG